MGSANSVQGRGGDGSQQGVHESQEEGRSSTRREMQDFMEESPPRDSREASEMPVLFNPQASATPLPQSVEMNVQSVANLQNNSQNTDNYNEKGIPALIKWIHGGTSVAVAGSWDNWETIKPLHRSGKEFVILKVLHPGIYQYRFLVDGEWRYAPDFPCMHDEMGHARNILDLQEYVPDNIESLTYFEIPQSPDSSYDDDLYFREDYTKDPPPVPLQLNTPPYIENDLSSFWKPPHVVLNHLYIQKPTMGQQVVAVGETCRFQSKYVTAVLFKSLRRP